MLKGTEFSEYTLSVRKKLSAVFLGLPSSVSTRLSDFSVPSDVLLGKNMLFFYIFVNVQSVNMV